MDAIAGRGRQQLRRNEILAAAVDEINRRGMRGMTLASVAGQINLAAPAVIYYFGSKDELIAAAFLKAISLYDSLAERAESAPTPAERISALIRRFFDWRTDVATGAAAAAAIFNDVRALNNTEVNESFVALFRRVRRLLPHAAFLSAMERNARAHLLLSQLFWAAAWSRAYNPRDYPGLADRMTDILLDGLVQESEKMPSPALPSPAPSDQRAEDPSELFLRAATELINAEGYHGASVERISARVHVTKGAFYHYNDTKDDLVAACFARTVEAVWRTLEKTDARETPGLLRLVHTCAALAERQFRGEAPLLSTTALSTLPEAIRAGVTEKIEQIALKYAMTLCDGVADGSIRPVDVNVAAQLIVGAVNATADLRFWTPRLDPSAVLTTFVRPIFEGLSAPPTQRTCPAS